MSLPPVVVKTQVSFVIPFTNFTSPTLWTMFCQMLEPHMSFGIVFSRYLLLTKSAHKKILPNLLQISLFLAATFGIRDSVIVTVY